MTITNGTMISAFIILVALCVVLSIPSLRTHLVGGGGVRTALIPLVVAGIFWLTGAAGDLLRARIDESTVPSDVLSVRIQAVQFGLPRISNEYQQVDMQEADVARTLSSLTAYSNAILVTDNQYDTLNRLAKASPMIHLISNQTKATGAIVADLLKPALLWYFDYVTWGSLAQSWSRYLAAAPTDADREAVMTDFLSQAQNGFLAAGIFRKMVELASTGDLNIPTRPADCSATPLTVGQATDRSDGDIEVEISKYNGMRLPGASDADLSRRVADLLKFGCLKSLSAAFATESQLLTDEAQRMRSYIDEWNEIFSSNEAASISLRVAISNLGKYDSFVRDEAKAVVGTPGAQIVSFTVREHDVSANRNNSGDDASSGSFLQIRSRETRIFTFYAEIPESDRSKLNGAYASEDNIIRLGMIASAGSSEETVISEIAEFSAKAAEQSTAKVANLRVSL